MKKNKTHGHERAYCRRVFTNVERLASLLPSQKGRFREIKFNLGKSLERLKPDQFEIVNVAPLSDEEARAVQLALTVYVRKTWPSFRVRANKMERILIVAKAEMIQKVREVK